MQRILTKNQLIERSLTKKYRKELWNPFVAAIKQYELIEAGDRIAVCISGGKDSMLLAKLMQLLNRHTETPFELKFICMNPGYNEKNLKKIEENAKLLEIPVTVFESDIFRVVNNMEGSPCYMCARMRRGYLYSKAKELGCNKIALGHHMSDVIETTVMGMFYGAQLQGMMPKLHSTNYTGMELIRPLYRINEKAIINWQRYNELEFIACACKMTENAEIDESKSKRRETKLLIQELKKNNPDIEKNIFNSIHAANIDTLVGYKLLGEQHTFLDNY